MAGLEPCTSDPPYYSRTYLSVSSAMVRVRIRIRLRARVGVGVGIRGNYS